MNTHILQRVEQGEDGTIGMLMGQVNLWTLEEEKNDPNGYPRIPAGTYRCERSFYHKGGYPTFEVTGVPGRSRILFHKGNTENDTMGCILLGTTRGKLAVPGEEDGTYRERIAVLGSAVAFRRFMAAMNDANIDAFDLEIRDIPEDPEPVVKLVDSGSTRLAA